LDKFDIIVVGAGPGGYPAAIRAAQLGAKVALVDKAKVGGTCLHRGCIPSKIGLHVAELCYEIEHAKPWGLTVDKPKLDWAQLVQKRQGILTSLENGIQGLLKSHKIQLFSGVATLQNDHQVEMNSQKLEAGKIILATGSVAGRPKIFSFDGYSVITSEEVFSWKELPTSLAVIGAGPEGCEWACMFASLGVEVGLIEAESRLLPREEPWVGRELEKIFTERKVGVFTGASVESIQIKEKDWISLNLTGGTELEVNRIIVATGRKPNIDKLLGSAVSLEMENGFIKVNETLQTNLPNVYAIGDVNGLSMLAHSATHQGLIAVEHALGKGARQFNAQNVPGVIFTFPEVARVGLTESELKAKGVDYQVGRFGFASLGKALAMGAPEGMVSLLSEKSTGKVLGGTVLGKNASDLIAEITLTQSVGLKLADIAHTIHAHPTLNEAVMEAAEDTHGMSIHRYKKRN